MFNLKELKKEYIILLEQEVKSIKKLQNNPYKQSFLNSLEELKQRINSFQGEDLIILRNFGKSIFKGGNVNVMAKHLFNNPFNKELYPDGFFNSVGSSQTSVYSIIKGGHII